MRALMEYPLVFAALVALCGVGLITFGSLAPAAAEEAEPQRAQREQLLRKHVVALAELLHAGASGAVEVANFGDGLGLGVAYGGVAAGDSILTVPEGLALDVNTTPSCHPEQTPEADCRIERAVHEAVAKGEASRLTGLLTLLVMERRRGHTSGLPRSAASSVLEVLPELNWQAEHGLFAIDPDEFRVLGVGTSMERWRVAAESKTSEAHNFIQLAGSGALGTEMGGEVSIEEVRWAYLMLHAYGQWTDDESLDDGVELSSKVVFLWPLFLARPTPEWQHGVKVSYDPARKVFDVVASRAMKAHEEVLFVDRRLSDASALSFRGLWLSSRHRARLDLNVSAVTRDPLSQPILQKFGCGAQPLRLYVEARKGVDPLFLSCMRLLALANKPVKLRRAVDREEWTKDWPETLAIDRRSESAAAELAIGALQQALHRLAPASAQIRQKYGSERLASRPIVRVREAETMVIVGLLKSMKELELLSHNEYLFDALRDAQRRPASAPSPKGSAKAGTRDSGGGGGGGSQ
mmetsp:Transcript_80802/g.227498  ORF Transcript_80802/g.227498 Transcript_80802/m.227498 type:complete len:522 (-) Transcript_80802:13-1578(-)